MGLRSRPLSPFLLFNHTYMKTIICRKLEWDAGHRIVGHEGKCANLHGHRYVAGIYIGADGLDPLGRVIDFSFIKEKIGEWIDKNWDHNMILAENDPIIQQVDLPDDMVWEWLGRKPFIIKRGQPTAENIAAELLEVAKVYTPKHLTVLKIVVHETPNCSAEVFGVNQ